MASFHLLLIAILQGLTEFLVKLTEKGRALKSTLIPIAKHVNDQPLTEFDSDDIVQLKKMLEWLRNNLTGENK